MKTQTPVAPAAPSTNPQYFKDIAAKLADKLTASGWRDFLKTFLFSDEMVQILKSLQSLSVSGKRFTPPLKTTFAAFENCPIDQLKVVIVGNDPYNLPNQSDGMLFSCSNFPENEPHLALQQFMMGVRTDALGEIIPEEEFKYAQDLTYLAKQGVLLLNYPLTVEIGKHHTHAEIWQPFIAYLLHELSSRKDGLIFVFLGAKAQTLTVYIDETKHTVFTRTHPLVGATYANSGWNPDRLFTRINEQLISKDPFSAISFYQPASAPAI
jgi:uracil-DNA glycosylase